MTVEKHILRAGENKTKRVILATVDPGTATKDTKENAKKVDRKGIGGQPSIVSKFPGIVDVAAEFIKQHDFSAQNR